MREDVELTRRILLTLLDWAGPGYMQGLDGVEDVLYRNHAYFLVERGLAEMVPGASLLDGVPHVVMLRRVTADGQEYARAIEQDTVWEKAKTHTLASVGFLTTEGIKAALAAIARGAFP